MRNCAKELVWDTGEAVPENISDLYDAYGWITSILFKIISALFITLWFPFFQQSNICMWPKILTVYFIDWVYKNHDKWLN